MYPIVKAPNQILRNPAQTVDFDVKKVVAEMKQTLIGQKDPEGVGLAANQVNLPYKIFLARFDTKKNSPIYTFINPEIIEHSQEYQKEDKHTPLEGCLSLPKYYGYVKRYQWVKVKYQTLTDSDRHLQTKEEVFEGFPAVVIQHEMDHLNGKIFVERILEQNGRLYKITGKNKKGKEEWSEVELG